MVGFGVDFVVRIEIWVHSDTPLNPKNIAFIVLFGKKFESY